MIMAALLPTTGRGAEVGIVPIRVGPGADVEPAVATNPANPNQAVMVWQISMAGGIYYASTVDGWATKHVATMPGLLSSSGDGSVVYDPIRSVFVACFLAAGVSSYEVRYAESSISIDGQIVFKSTNLCNVGNVTGDKPWIAVGPRPGVSERSNLYVAYSTGAIGRDMRLIRSISDGLDCNDRAWTSPTALAPTGTGAFPLISPNDAETLYIPYWVDNPSESQNDDQRIEIVKSANAHQSNIDIVFGSELLVANLDDTDANDLRDFIPGNFTRVAKFPWMAIRNGLVNSKDRIYLVWSDVGDGTDCGVCPIEAGGTPNTDVDIWFAALSSDPNDDDDWTFVTNPTVISPDSGAEFPCPDQWFPSICVDPDNTLHVFYFDNRLTPSAESVDCAGAATFDLYYTSSTNEGQSWSAPARVGNLSSVVPSSGTFIGDYRGAAAGKIDSTIKVYGAYPRSETVFIGYDFNMYLGKVTLP